jgi:hypothetical protein
MRGLVILSVLI